MWADSARHVYFVFFQGDTSMVSCEVLRVSHAAWFPAIDNNAVARAQGVGRRGGKAYALAVTIGLIPGPGGNEERPVRTEKLRRARLLEVSNAASSNHLVRDSLVGQVRISGRHRMCPGTSVACRGITVEHGRGPFPPLHELVIRQFGKIPVWQAHVRPDHCGEVTALS